MTALFDGMIAVSAIISGITFYYHSGIVLGELIAFFVITNGKMTSFFTIMAAVLAGIIRASKGRYLFLKALGV